MDTSSDAAREKAHPTAGDTIHYKIRVQNHLGPHWVDWFNGMIITQEADGSTMLHGDFVDQAALHGVLRRIRDAGMVLLSVNQLDAE